MWYHYRDWRGASCPQNLKLGISLKGAEKKVIKFLLPLPRDARRSQSKHYKTKKTISIETVNLTRRKLQIPEIRETSRIGDFVIFH